MKKTFIFSRHTLRRPLFEYMSFVDKLNVNEFRDWSTENLEITKKGILVEKKLDEYLKKYLPKDSKYSLNITNTNRTQETAKLIIKNLYNEDINPKFYVNMNKFYDIFPNSNIDFKNKLIKILEDRYSSLDLKKLYSANEFLIKFINDNKKSIFNFENYNLGFDFRDSFLPIFSGEQYILFQLTDILYSEFYDGYFKDIDVINKIKYIKLADLELISKTNGVCEYLAMPILKELYNFLFSFNKYNTNILVGHDVNILAILKSLNIDYFEIDKAIEIAPIGSKIVISLDEKIEIRLIYMDNYNFDEVVDKLLLTVDINDFKVKLEKIFLNYDRREYVK